MVTVGESAHVAHTLARRKALQAMRKKTLSTEKNRNVRHRKEEERSSKTIRHHDQHSYLLQRMGA